MVFFIKISKVFIIKLCNMTFEMISKCYKIVSEIFDQQNINKKIFLSLFTKTRFLY